MNKVILSVVVYDKLQPKAKHKVQGKREFHLHKLVKVRPVSSLFSLPLVDYI